MKSPSAVSRWRYALAVLLLGLSGCVSAPRLSLPTVELPNEWISRQAALQSWVRFDLRGKVSIVRGEESVVAVVRWRQRGETLRLALEGPLGMGASEWTFDSARSDETLIAIGRRLGVALPIASVRYWALGVPDPQLEVQAVEIDNERLSALQQQGWSIRYLDYARVPGANFDLPRRLQLESSEVRVRMFIDSWESFER
ncbi:MAG: outer membrane lipoprotein LolB [Steroidobacteraceae bacterium]